MKTFKIQPHITLPFALSSSRISLCNSEAILFMKTLNCKTCNKEFIVHNNREKTAKFCSRECNDYSYCKPNSGCFKKGELNGVQYKKGDIPWSTGKKWATSDMLQTDILAYKSMHKRVGRKFNKTGFCEHCKCEKRTVWASIEHKYIETDRSNWLELCQKCHVKMDMEYYKIIKL